MKIRTYNPDQLHTADTQEIAALAAQGFEQPLDTAMLADTMRHIEAAHHVQLATIEDDLVGFALYRRCLWRPSN